MESYTNEFYQRTPSDIFLIYYLLWSILQNPYQLPWKYSITSSQRKNNNSLYDSITSKWLSSIANYKLSLSRVPYQWTRNLRKFTQTENPFTSKLLRALACYRLHFVPSRSISKTPISTTRIIHYLCSQMYMSINMTIPTWINSRFM